MWESQLQEQLLSSVEEVADELSDSGAEVGDEEPDFDVFSPTTTGDAMLLRKSV